MNNKCLGCESVFQGGGELCAACHAGAHRQTHLLSAIVISFVAVSLYGLMSSSPPPSTVPAAAPALASGIEWNETTMPYRDPLIARLHGLAREDSRCARIEPSSLTLVSSVPAANPDLVFEVICTAGPRSVSRSFALND